jgi:glycosyltransferase involved in cell wall biosynthesis
MKIALIVQRYGPEVLGGSETLARQYASFLHEFGEVEVLTTCALEHTSWNNHFPAGRSEIDGISVRRFRVDALRSPYWGKLYEMLKGSLDERTFSGSQEQKQLLARRLATWPDALQEETVRWQGPYSSDLLSFLRQHRQSYDLFLFFTYLFPTSYFGMQCVPRGRILFCPTLHDEPIAYLSIFRRMFGRPGFTIFLTETERLLASRLYGSRTPSDVVGMALTQPDQIGRLPPGTPGEFVLYAGRIEPSKGTGTLIEYFNAFKEAQPSALKLVMIGAAGAELPQDNNVVYLGFVSEAEKFALARSARAFLHPSPYESFAIVLLEAFLMGTPALVNGHSPVLVEHCRRGSAGLCYTSRQEFIQHLSQLVGDPALRGTLGRTGRRYAETNYLAAQVREKLYEVVIQAASRTGASEPRGQLSCPSLVGKRTNC